MAMTSIRRWQLAVLRVSLEIADEPVVVSELSAYPNGVEEQYWQRRDPLAAFGLSGTTPPDTPLRLPPGFGAELADSVRDNTEDRAALWLRLVPPYGYLGAVRWEDVVTETGLPLLRVPDRMPVPAALGTVWTVVIIACAEPDQAWAADHVRNLVGALGDRLGAGVVDVFADAGTHARLASEPPGSGAVTVRIHASDRAHTAFEERNDRPPTSVELVWPEWIAEGMRGVAARALHIAVPGAFEGTLPRLGLPPDPASPTAGSLRVGPEHIARLADSIGATLVSLASPPTDSSDAAVRLVADTIGRTRPGPTVFSSIVDDPTTTVLAEAHTFAAGAQQTPRLPRDPSFFGYLQPESVDRALNVPGFDSADVAYVDSGPPVDISSSRPVFEKYSTTAEVPAWVAATSAQLDSRRADLARGSRYPAESTPTDMKLAYDRGAASALSEIQDLITRYAGDS